MGKAATNLAIVLGLITIAFAGYYMYTQKSAATLNPGSNNQTMQNMLSETRAFINHRQTLNQIELDIDIFEDVRFTSLRSFSTPIQKAPIGRPDPFTKPTTEVSPSSGNTTTSSGNAPDITVPF